MTRCPRCDTEMTDIFGLEYCPKCEVPRTTSFAGFCLIVIILAAAFVSLKIFGVF